MDNPVKKRKQLRILFLCLCILSGGRTAYAEKKLQTAGIEPIRTESITDLSKYKTNEVIVVWKPDEKKKNGAWKRTEENPPAGMTEQTLTRDITLMEADSRNDLNQAISELSKDKAVSYVQPNYTYHLSGLTDDTYTEEQWAYRNESYQIGMDAAWQKGKGNDKETIIAVMDSGIDYRHEDLKDAMWVNEKETAGDSRDNDKNGYTNDIHGWNFVSDSADICRYAVYEDQYADNHGTHVAGIIAATADNKAGIAGVASRSEVKLMSLKVFPDNTDEGAATSDIVEAIAYAEKKGAVICNMSFGGEEEEEDQLLYQTMKESDLLFICAAGNGNSQTGKKGFDLMERPQIPASFDLDNIICVGNVNASGALDPTSCYSVTDVDIAAPGTKIISTVVTDPKSKKGKYASYTGTSMATPMVTGAAAVIASYYGKEGVTVSWKEIKEAVLNGAKENIQLSGKVAGNRYLNVAGALDYDKNAIFASVKIVPVKNSTNKNIKVSLSSPDAKITSFFYEPGKWEAAYFSSGNAGIQVKQSNGCWSFPVNKSGEYTIYAKNQAGGSIVKIIKVNISR